METHEFGTVFLFSISRAGCSSVARKPLRSVRVNGVGSHEIGSGFNSRRRSQPGSIPGRGPAGFNSLDIRSHPRFNSLGIRSHPRFNSRCKRAMIRKPFTTLFQASWLSVEAFTSHS